jgi:cytochrome b6-f complex iron-sulfur subunit
MADAAKPAAPAAKAKAGEEGMDRREVLVLGAGWAAFTAAIGVSLGGLVRFLYPSVTFEPPQRFKVGFPSEFAEGVSEKFKAEFGVWIVRNSEEIYALIAICTHLGCSPGWLAGEKKFKCPCHGSGFYSSGINFEGPAPRPLERAAIKIDDDGQLLVDKDRKFLYELDQWKDPASRVPFKA